MHHIKKTITFLLICLFSGCGWWFSKSNGIKNLQEYKDLMANDFSSISAVKKAFPTTEQDVNNRVQYCISLVKNGLDEILKIKSQDRTFQNTAAAFDEINAIFSRTVNPISILDILSPDKQLRDACHNATLKLREFATDAFSNKGLFLAFKAYISSENIKKEKLNEEQKYYLQETIKSFKREGLDLPEKELNKVKELKKTIAELELKFAKNINSDKSKCVVSKKELSGLDEDFVKNLKHSDNAKYILDCDYPTYLEVRDHCSDSSTREKMYFTFTNRAYAKNLEALNQLITKRDELAKTLNFESFAHLDLEYQMVKTPKQAADFLENIIEKAMKKQAKELNQLIEEFPSDLQLDKNGKMNPWDYDYLLESYKKKHFNLDEREIANYFPVEHTLTKIFEIYQQFLGLKFVWYKEKDFWHNEVMAIQVYDKETDEFIGTLLLDLFPREDKEKHAGGTSIAILTTKKSNPETSKDKTVTGVIVVIANFPKPTPEHPALLKHEDLITFFHEFGHAMHGFLGRTQMTSFSGFRVKRDFVEMPSQMFEEWPWDKQVLKNISSHYKTCEPLPDDLIDKKLALKKFDRGHWLTMQGALSFLALEYFAQGEKKDTDLIRKKIFEKYMPQIRFEPQAHMQTSFVHLTNYAAKFYGYMWARVFSLDLFDQIKKVGLLDFSIGKKFRDEILKKGGSVDPDKLLQNFLGREPQIDAFLKTYELVEN